MEIRFQALSNCAPYFKFRFKISELLYQLKHAHVMEHLTYGPVSIPVPIPGYARSQILAMTIRLNIFLVQ